MLGGQWALLNWQQQLPSDAPGPHIAIPAGGLSKLVAEALVWKAWKCGLPVLILRAGYTQGDKGFLKLNSENSVGGKMQGA